MDVLGYFVPGALLVVLALPLTGKWLSGDHLRESWWILLAAITVYCTGFVLSTACDRMLGAISSKTGPTNGGLNVRTGQLVDKLLDSLHARCVGNRMEGEELAVSSGGVPASSPALSQSVQQLQKRSTGSTPSALRADETLLICEAMLRGTAAGDELDRARAMTRMTAGIAGAGGVGAVVSFALCEPLVGVLALCFLILGCCLSWRDHVEQQNAILASVAARCWEPRDKDI